MSIFNQTGAQSSDRKFYYAYMDIGEDSSKLIVDSIPFKPKRIDGYNVYNPYNNSFSAFCWNNDTFCQAIGYGSFSNTAFTVDISQNSDETYKASITFTNNSFEANSHWRIIASNISGWGN